MDLELGNGGFRYAIPTLLDWTGREAPVDIMMEVARRALG
jgi:hypothetical protein